MVIFANCVNADFPVTKIFSQIAALSMSFQNVPRSKYAFIDLWVFRWLFLVS